MDKISDGFQGEKAIVTPYSVRHLQQENPLTCNLFVTHIGYYPHAKCHFRNRPKGAPEHILIYCEQGSGWIEIAQKRYTLRKNQAYIIPATVAHIYAADRLHPWSIYWIHFKGKNSMYYMPIMNKILNIEDNVQSQQQPRIQLFESIFQNLQHGYLNSNLEYSSICLQHFLASLMYITQFNRLTSTQDQDIIHQSISFMRNHLEDRLTLEDIAAAVRYSPTYFGAIFKEKTSFSPIEYYNQLKIQRSCSMLQFTELKIKEIAFRLGYYDAFHFSKAFTKEMEISPRSYRKRYQ